MIKRGVYIVLLVAMVFGISSCDERKIIPDETLSKIFHDAFVVNAYIDEERINIDSLYIYEPIFRRYGYSTADVMHTIGNFSRRKSVRLGSIVEESIAQLERESRAYEKQVVILDTIRNVAVRTSKREIYRDTLIVAKKRADSTNLHIVITPAPRGEYNISYNYDCNDDLEKYSRTSEFYFMDENGYQRNRVAVTMREKGVLNRTLVTNDDCRNLVLNLGKYTNLDKNVNTSGQRGKKGKKNKKRLPPKTQDLTIRNLRVTYKLKEADAIDSLFERYVDVKIFADGFLIQKDSLALSADTTRVSTPTSRND